MVHYDPGILAADALERLVADADAAPGVGRAPSAADRRGADRATAATPGPISTTWPRAQASRPARSSTIHAGTDYLVYMMGFMPGFPYLGGMSPRIATPRLGTPRTVVPAGSVGIAGAQTGIYPTEQPGRVAADRPDAAEDVRRGAHAAGG